MITQQTIVLAYNTPRDREEAAKFVATLAREGLTFKSTTVETGAHLPVRTFEIDLTGGY